MIESQGSASTNLQIASMLGQAQQYALIVTTNPTLSNVKYWYELLDNVFMMVVNVISEGVTNEIVVVKKGYLDLYECVLIRMHDEDVDDEDKPPSLRELMDMERFLKGFQALLYKGLQEQGYQFITNLDKPVKTGVYKPDLNEPDRGGLGAT